MTEKPKRHVAETWKKVDGDNTLAIDWPLDENSVVFEIGAYEGRWALQMYEKYKCDIFAFEPQKWALDRWLDKPGRIRTFNFALWTYDGELPLGDFGRDGASLVKQYHQDQETVRCLDIYKWIDTYLGVEEIDVMLMNIEGGEWSLLPYMIGLGMMDRIKYFWMQCHLFTPYGPEKLVILREQLAKTHEIYWDYAPAAVAWKRNDL